MNKVWMVMVLLGLTALTLSNPSQTVEIALQSCANAVVLCIQLAGIYAFWLGMLELLEQSGIAKIVAQWFAPFTRWLFPSSSNKAQEHITINLVSNFLGMGNAATPSGIEAMVQLETPHPYANANMILFMVMNSTAVQLFPTTVVGILALNGSSNPGSIVLPTLIASIFATGLGVLLCKVIEKLWWGKQK